MINILKKTIQNILKQNGFEIKKLLNSDLERRLQIVKDNEIDVLMDIGANQGQYATEMRREGYNNKIVSFEPLQNAFETLNKKSLKDTNWEAHNYALGNENTKSVINVAGNSFSSSINDMLQNHLDSAPESKYVSQQEIEVKRLDDIFSSFCDTDSKVMLKIDTQGYEKNVLDGALESLKHVSVVQIEMSIVPLYANETTYVDMINYLTGKGFELYSLENGFSSPQTGQLLQVDGLFVKHT